MKKQMQMIERVIMPANPNLDKLVSYWLLLYFGVESLWELAKSHTVEFFTTGTLPKGMKPKDVENSVFLDCGGGDFDGHGRNKDKSGTQLVADALGLYNDPRFNTLIRRVTTQDKHGRGPWSKRHLASVVINAYRMGRSFEDVCTWVFQALEAISNWEGNLSEEERRRKDKHLWYSLQIHCVRKVMGEEGEEWLAWGNKVLQEVDVKIAEAEEQLRTATFCVIPTRVGKRKLFFCKSDTPFLANRALQEADIVVSRLEQPKIGSSTTMIAVSSGSQLHLQRVAVGLRRAEAQKMSIQIDEDLLGCEGQHPQVPNWHVLENGRFSMILNGSEQHPFVEPTLLNSGEIEEIINEAMKPRWKESKAPRWEEKFCPGVGLLEHAFQR